MSHHQLLPLHHLLHQLLHHKTGEMKVSLAHTEGEAQVADAAVVGAKKRPVPTILQLIVNPLGGILDQAIEM